MNEKEQFLEQFNNSLHRLGRLVTISVILILVSMDLHMAGTIRIIVGSKMRMFL